MLFLKSKKNLKKITKNNKIKKSSLLKKLQLGLYVKEAYLFLITQLLGIIVGVYYVSYKSTLSQADTISFPIWWFLLYFLTVTVLFFFLVKYIKSSGLFFKVIFVVVLFTGSQVFFSLFIDELIASLLAFVLVTIRFYYPTVWMHNLTLILGLGGICGTWGLGFSVLSMIIILLVLSVYDYIAVYKTKHMVKMAESMMKYNVLLALIIPENEKDYLVNLNKVPPTKGGFMILGGGDLALPLLFVVSVLANYTVYHSLIVLVFILLGLFVMHYIFVTQRFKKPMPALPPLAIFSIIGFLFSLLIFYL